MKESRNKLIIDRVTEELKKKKEGTNNYKSVAYSLLQEEGLLFH